MNKSICSQRMQQNLCNVIDVSTSINHLVIPQPPEACVNEVTWTVYATFYFLLFLLYMCRMGSCALEMWTGTAFSNTNLLENSNAPWC